MLPAQRQHPGVVLKHAFQRDLVIRPLLDDVGVPPDVVEWARM